MSVMQEFSVKIAESVSCPGVLAEKLWSDGLIVLETKQFVTQIPGTTFTLMQKLLDDFRKILKGSKDKEKIFSLFCEHLKGTLADHQKIVEDMKEKIGMFCAFVGP